MLNSYLWEMRKYNLNSTLRNTICSNYYISRESSTTRNVLWSRVCVCPSVCLCVCMPTLLHGSGCNLPQVVHYWADLQSVHRLRCCGNITRTRNVSEYMLVLALCLVIVWKSLYCIYFGISWTCFSVITAPYRNLCGWNLEYKWRRTVHTRTRRVGEIAPGVPPQCAKTCFVFFLLSIQRGLSVTYPAPISTIFETTDVNRFPHACTGEKFPNFCARVFPRLQNSPKYGTIR